MALMGITIYIKNYYIILYALPMYEIIIVKAVERSLDIYLQAARGEYVRADLDTDKFLKIDELAKAARETMSTIRYLTKQGLLEVAEITDSGYQIYALEMVIHCARIKKLKQKRLTLEEIKKKLRSNFTVFKSQSYSETMIKDVQ